MRRTVIALLMFVITAGLIMKGSFALRNECELLRRETEEVLNLEEIRDEDFYKIDTRFEKNSFLFSVVLGSSQKDEMEKNLKMAKKLLHTSQEEGRSLLYSFMLDVDNMAKSEKMSLENII